MLMAGKEEDLRKAVEVLLDIPEIEVEEVIESRNGDYIVTAVSTRKGTECRITAGNG